MTDQSGLQYRNISELRDNIGWFIGMGVGLMVLGCLAIVEPFVATIAIEVLVGVLFVTGGIMLFYHAIRWRRSNMFVVELLNSLLYAAVGVMLLAYPLQGMITLTFLMTVLFLGGGLFKVIHAFQTRPAARWGWVLASGILSLALGLPLLVGMPVTAFRAIGLIVGIDLLFTGWSMLMLSLALRNSVASGRVICLWGSCYST